MPSSAFVAQLRLGCSLGAIAWFGCLINPGAFGCSDDADCVLNGRDGFCIQDYCAFEDPECDSNRSFHEYAPPGLAGTCVEPTSTDDGSSGSGSGEAGSSGVPAEVLPADDLFPAAGAMDVFSSEHLTARWADAEAVASPLFDVTTTSGETIAGVVRIEGDVGNAATFVPNAPLPLATTVMVTLSGAIVDRSGNSRSIDESWSFEVIDPGASHILLHWAHDNIADERELLEADFTDNFGPAVGSLAGYNNGLVWAVADPGADPTRGKVLRSTVPANTLGNGNGMSATALLPEGHTELYAAYDLYLSDDYVFSLGMSLPGFLGGARADINQLRAWACCEIPPIGSDVWSMTTRYFSPGSYPNILPRTNVIYFGSAYPLQEFCGGDETAIRQGEHRAWNGRDGTPVDDGTDGYEIPLGRWIRIEHRMKLNTPGVEDGVMEAWVDGVKVFEDTSFLFRCNEVSEIQMFSMPAFFGGSGMEWSVPQINHHYFDNWVISTRSLLQ